MNATSIAIIVATVLVILATIIPTYVITSRKRQRKMTGPSLIGVCRCM